MPTHWESCAEPIPGYRLLERLGRGGFGEVWKAEAPGGLLKAIKFVSGTLAGERDQNHAEQELKALERVRGVRHPFVLSMERYDIVDGQLLIVMELADRSLDDRLRECRRQGLSGIPRTELLKYLGEAAEALDLMNGEHDLQHLDIKPQNLFLVAGHVKVADFGLVKDLEGHTAHLTGGVTPVYAAPETFDGWVSRSSDQYSLGIVFMELLTGQRPFPGPSARQYMMQHLTGEPDLQALPSHDRPIVRRALSKDPNQRFASCVEFVACLRDLSAAAASAPAPCPPTPLRLEDPEENEGSRSTCLSVRTKADLKGDDTTVRTDPVLGSAKVPASAVHERGTLYPTLVLGIGATGIRSIERLRRKLERRFGSPDAWPAIRLLGVDSDPEVLKELAKTEPVSRDAADQTLLCKLRKPSQYFKAWESFKHLASWLNPNQLFQISVSGATNGQRALGRLAFADNYRRILARVRSELEQLLDPARIAKAADAGWTYRSELPRVFVVAAMGGGTGSGMFIDLCYLARRVLLEAGASRPDIQGMLLAGVHPSARDADLRRTNHYAIAQNLLDLSHEPVEFSATYEADVEPERHTGPPLEAVYFLDQTAGHLSEPRDEAALDAAAEFLLEEAAGSLGRDWDRIAREEAWPKFRSMGWFSLVYPRRALLRHTAAALCQTLLRRWLEPIGPKAGEEIARQSEASLSAAGFDPATIASRLLDEVNLVLSEPLHVLVAHELTAAEDRLAASDSAAHPVVCLETIDRLKNLLGLDPGEDETEIDEMPLLDRLLRDITNRVAGSMFSALAESVRNSLDLPGARLANARLVLDGFARYFLHRVDEQQEVLRQSHAALSRRARELRERPVRLPKAVLSGPIASVIEPLEAYAREKIECRLREQTVQMYLVLRAKLSDAARDLVSLRQEIERASSEVASVLDESGVANGYCSQTLFPGGVLAMHEAADEFYRQLAGGLFAKLEERIQDAVFIPGGGFWETCKSAERLAGGLAGTMLAETMTWADEMLPMSDVTDAFFDRHRRDREGLPRELAAFYDWAKPSVHGRTGPRGEPPPLREVAILSIPDSRSGTSFREAAGLALPLANFQTVHGDGQCVFLRVAGHENLAKLLPLWVLEARKLFDRGCQTPLSPEIFPQLASNH